VGASKGGAVVSLRKSPTLTPALLAANRRNAQKSTGPRTERGKNWSRVNRLRTGLRSPSYCRFVDAVLAAMPGEVRRTAEASVPPHLMNHPLYLDFLVGILETDVQLGAKYAEQEQRLERMKEMTFQAGMSLKKKEVQTRQPGRPTDNATPTVGQSRPPVDPAADRKTTFQAGMSLKTPDVENLASSQQVPSTDDATPRKAGTRATRSKRKSTFQAGMSLETEDVTDEQIEFITDKARKMGLPKSFFDWVDREIRGKMYVPSRNVDENN
jgi:hypothetical protein